MTEKLDEDYAIKLLKEKGIRIYKEEITYVDEEIYDNEIEIGFNGAIFIRIDEIGDIKDKTIKDLLIDGLITDGAHHKQWYLEQLLIKLGFDLDKVREEIQKEGYDFEEGIPP